MLRISQLRKGLQVIVLLPALLLTAAAGAQEAASPPDGRGGGPPPGGSKEAPPAVKALELRVAALEAELARLRKVAESRQRSAEASAALLEAVGLQDTAQAAAEAWREFCAGEGAGTAGCGG